ncbi:hypothetical protein AB5N19_12362 [Seiridium cardinale]
MAANVTRELLTCGHEAETLEKYGHGLMLLTETKPVTFACPDCIPTSRLLSWHGDLCMLHVDAIRDLRQLADHRDDALAKLTLQRLRGGSIPRDVLRALEALIIRD